MNRLLTQRQAIQGQALLSTVFFYPVMLPGPNVPTRCDTTTFAYLLT
jgi:hypothetical protein